MTHKIVNLRPDPKLFHHNFEGYKLSLESIPVFRSNHAKDVLRVRPTDEQFSLMHIQLFAMQNHLFMDPWSREQGYYVNVDLEIVRTSYNLKEGSPERSSTVFQLKSMTERRPGDYNYTLHFISEKYAIVCDGIGSLMLLNTGNRTKVNHLWSQGAQYSFDYEGEKRGFVILDARLDQVQGCHQISLALGHIERIEKEYGGTMKNYMHITWATWSLSEERWIFAIKDILEGSGALHYCAFEPKAESLIICSNFEYTWRSNPTLKEDSDGAKNDEQEKLFHYKSICWSQTSEDVKIYFTMTSESTEGLTVSSEQHEFSIIRNGEKMSSFKVERAILPERTKWSMSMRSLHVTLFKKDILQWQSLFQDLDYPEEMSTDEFDALAKTTHNHRFGQELESGMELADDKEIYIYRHNLPAKVVTHVVSLGTSPPLFKSVLRAGFPPAIVTAEDVDACIWLQHYVQPTDTEWSLRHEGSLHALAYIQASKRQRKYMDCSPDFDYCVICESYRHVFLYHSKYDTANGLRKRHGPQVAIGKQQLVTLEEDVGEVLGMTITNDLITLLTEKALLHVQINAS